MQKWCFSPEGHPQHCVHRPVYVDRSLIDCCSEPSPSPAEARRFPLYVSSTRRRHSPSQLLALQVAAVTLSRSNTGIPANLPHMELQRENPKVGNPSVGCRGIRWRGCVSILHPGLQQGPNNGRRPDGRLVHNTSLEYSRYIRVALMPILSLSETVTVSTGLGLNKAAV